MSEQAVEVRGLRVRRGRADVFAGLDLDIPRGTITGLLGSGGGVPDAHPPGGCRVSAARTLATAGRVLR